MSIHKIKMSKSEAIRTCEDSNWDPTVVATIDDENLKQLRSDLLKIFPNELKDYRLDVVYGIMLKAYFDTKPWFTLRLASSTEFWSGLSIKIVPDLVAKRHGTNLDYYYKKPTRIWLRAIWWYTFLAWQGNAEDTYAVLTAPIFNTDSIVGLTERSGRDGIRLDLYESIMRIGSLVTSEQKAKFNEKAKSSDTVFRAIMRINTSKTLTIEPSLYKGGVDEYVKHELYDRIGIEIAFDQNQEAENISPAEDTVIDRIEKTILQDVIVPEMDAPQQNLFVHSSIKVVWGDITTQQVDAIVNAANKYLTRGGGVCNAIHEAAGPRLEEECIKRYARCEVGDCKVTSAYNLPCKYVIHAVGPNCLLESENHDRERLLEKCYNSCLDVVEQMQLHSIAFCCISTGNFGYPIEDAAKVAIRTITQRLNQGLHCEVTICCFTQKDKDIYDSLIHGV